MKLLSSNQVESSRCDDCNPYWVGTLFRQCAVFTKVLREAWTAARRSREVLDCGSPLPLSRGQTCSRKAAEGCRTPRRWRAIRASPVSRGVHNIFATALLAGLVAWCFSTNRLSAVTFTENFSTDPTATGWQIFGNTNLFQWDHANQNLRVTWDSSQTNSYFHRPLGTILTRDDDFSLSFDLTFEDYASGTTPGKPFAAPTAIGFFNLDQATHTNFSRGAGINQTYGPRNLVEFNFFPPFDVFLPTIDQVLVSTNNAWLYNDDNLMEMTPGETFHIHMSYVAATWTLTTVISNNGAQYGLTQTIVVPTNFDFRVATLSVSSYSDVRDIGSVLAHGVVDDFIVTVPLPPLENLAGGFSGADWQVQFTSRTNWLYTLERTTDLQTWNDVTPNTPGNSALLTLTDTNPPPGNAAYRVKSQRP